MKALTDAEFADARRLARKIRRAKVVGFGHGDATALARLVPGMLAELRSLRDLAEAVGKAPAEAVVLTPVHEAWARWRNLGRDVGDAK